jgi:hypothetical protein
VTEAFENSLSSMMTSGFVTEAAMRALRESAQRRGSVTRAEAEFLFVMDRTGQIAGSDWFPVAVRAVRDVIVWESRPTGHVTEADADWLIGQVGDQPTAFGRAVVFAVCQEAESVPPRLSELAMRAAVGRCLLI